MNSVIAILLAASVIGPASAAIPTAEFTIPLFGAAEVTEPGDPDGQGSATLKLDMDRSEVCWTLSVSNLDAVTMSHVHRNFAGMAGPPVITLPDVGPGQSIACLPVAAQLLQQILADPSRFYVNVHTASFPMGALRGQLPRSDGQAKAEREDSITLLSGQWRLKGDLLIPARTGRQPAVLMLNKANGDRAAYRSLARELGQRGIASLRLDLRAHGESINAGKFVPFVPNTPDILDGSWTDIEAALGFLRSHPDIDGNNLAVVGASYSGEEMAVSARRSGRYARAYLALSPGSFSEESAAAIDASGARWLLIRSERERSPSVRAAAERMRARSKTGEVWVLDAASHASDLLAEVPDLPARAAAWLAATLNPGISGGSDQPAMHGVRASDGTLVHVYDYRPATPLRVRPILMFHQAGGDARGELGPIARRLAAQGRRVFTADLRSGGNRFGSDNATAAAFTGKEVGYCDVYPDIVAALDKAAAETGTPVIVAGSSYSAALVVKLAAEQAAKIAGFVAFSPAGGAPMKGCEADRYLSGLKVPGLVIRNIGPTEPPAWVADSNRQWQAAGRPVTTIRAEGHGASLLLSDRTKGDVAGAWNAFSAFLEKVDAAAAD